jgi:hypothetical protein
VGDKFDFLHKRERLVAIVDEIVHFYTRAILAKAAKNIIKCDVSIMAENWPIQHIDATQRHMANSHKTSFLFGREKEKRVNTDNHTPNKEFLYMNFGKAKFKAKARVMNAGRRRHFRFDENHSKTIKNGRAVVTHSSFKVLGQSKQQRWKEEFFHHSVKRKEKK